MTVKEAVSEYLLFKRASGLSSNTISDYEYHLLPFCRYFGDTFDIQEITYTPILKFGAYISEHYPKQGTRNTYVRNTKLFLRWLSVQYGPDFLKFSPERIPVPKRPKKDVYRLTRDDIYILFKETVSCSEWLTARNRAILALLLGSGLRLHEVVSLKANNIYLVSNGQNSVRVLGKGSKARAVGIGELAVYYIKRYLDLCPYKGSEFIFYTSSGSPLTDYSIKCFMHRLKVKTGIPFSSHSLRHNYASIFVDFNLDHFGRSGEMELSSIMGHASVNTTLEYVHIAHQERSVKSYLDILKGVVNPEEVVKHNA